MLTKMKKQILICIHGFNGDSKSSVISALKDELSNDNIEVLTFDLPCHGEDKTTNLKLIDCQNKLSNFVNSIIQNNDCPISFFATSFGAYLLLNYLNTSQYKFDKIILRCPAVFMDKVLYNKILPMNNLSYNDLKDNEINIGLNRTMFIDNNFVKELENSQIKNINNNYFYNIIQGKKDDIVDYKENELFFNNLSLHHKFYYFENANHRFKNKGELEKIIEITKNILINN